MFAHHGYDAETFVGENLNDDSYNKDGANNFENGANNFEDNGFKTLKMVLTASKMALTTLKVSI